MHKVMKRILCLFGVQRDRLENYMQIRIVNPSPAESSSFGTKPRESCRLANATPPYCL